MEWALCLGHAVIGAALLAFTPAGTSGRRRAIEAGAAAGAGLGVALIGAGAAGGRAWRSVAFDPETAVPAGFAIACAWVLVGAVGARAGRIEDAALTGVAASGLALAATGRYVVPALLFWLCSSIALAALAGAGGARRVWPGLALSDALVCAAAVAFVERGGEWTIGGGGGDLVFWLLAAGAAARGAVYLTGPGAAAGTNAAAAAPLLAGGAVALAVRAGRPDPWAALAVLGCAGAALGVALWKGGFTARHLAAWPAGLALAIAFVTPGHAPLVGAVAALAVTAAALMPFTGDRAGFERGVLVAAVPLTAGFGVVVAGATASFGRATDAATSLESAPWTAVAALLPAALAGGVVLGARAARTVARDLVPEAVLATWALLAAAVVVGLAPGLVGGSDAALGATGGVALLGLVALAGGMGASLAAGRWGVVLQTELAPAVAPPPGPESLVPPLVWASAAAGAATAVAAAWLTVAGLRVGFL
jgi:hypothetical protein